MTSAQNFSPNRQNALFNAVLNILCSQPRRADLCRLDLTESDWEFILALAERHRLKPLLSWRLTDEDPVPEFVRRDLKQAFIQSTFLSLELRKELVAIKRILDEADIPFIAMKGSYLAFFIYPHAALRPLRDLDILVQPRDAVRAFDCLLARGAARMKEFPGRPEAALAFGHHLPPLFSPSRRTIIEVHPRVLHPHILADPTRDLSWDERYWLDAVTRNIGGSAVRFSSPEDLLLQLVVHSVYEHSFNNGPLVLSDIGHLVDREALDWSLFWQLAERNGVERGAALLLRLFERLWGECPAIWRCSPSVSDCVTTDVVDAAAHLLFRDPETRNHVTLTYSLTRDKSLGARLKLTWLLLFPTRDAIASQFPVAANSPLIPLYYIKKWWRLLLQRAPAYLKDRRRGNFSTEVQGLSTVNTWLTRDAGSHQGL